MFSLKSGRNYGVTIIVVLATFVEFKCRTLDMMSLNSGFIGFREDFR